MTSQTPSSFLACATDEAKRLADKPEIQSMSKQEDRLNMAEVEMSILWCQCRDRWLGNKEMFYQEGSNPVST